MADSFAARFAAVRAEHGPLAWGLDPSGSVLEGWGVGDTPAGLDRFAAIALEAAAGTLGAVKLQAGSYERHGWQGFRTLQRLIGDARSAGLLVIVDAKRGDVGSTNDAYAEAFLGAHAPLGLGGLILAPGVGMQGATSRDVAQVFAACPDRVIPSASRSLLTASPDISGLRDMAAELALELRDALPSS